MSYEIKNPSFNFLTWRKQTDPAVQLQPGCQEEWPFCFPIYEAGDLKFQFRLTFDSYAEAFQFATAIEETVQLCMLSGTSNTDEATAQANIVRNYYTQDSKGFIKTITGDKEVTLYWPHGILNIAGVQPGTCFQLGIKIATETDNTDVGEFRAISNECFQRVETKCDTGLLKAYSYEDENDFRYCQFPQMTPATTAENAIRLPLLLNKPQNPKEQGVYRKSNGVLKKTYSVTKQTWEGKTDYMPWQYQRNAGIWLEHDEVTITTDAFDGKFVITSDMSLDWTDESEWITQASFKGEQTPFNVRNTNCSVCADCPQLVNFQLADNHFNYSNGTQSFTFTYTTTGPSFLSLTLQYRLHGTTNWTSVTIPNTGSASIGLPPGKYDFRAIPDATNCLPAFTAQIDNIGIASEPTCPKVLDILVSEITKFAAAGSWSAQLPTPTAGYDWQLLAADGVTIIAGENNVTSPDSTIIVALVDLTEDTDYIFQVRVNCSETNHSGWEQFPFTTEG